MTRYALVGAAAAAPYADALLRLPEVRIAAVVDEDLELRQSAVQLLGAAHQAATVDELLAAAGESCSAVLVHGAPASRLDHARAAMQHGKQVLLELPVANSADQVGALTEECRDAGVVLMVSGTLRFLPSQQVLKGRLDAGKLGTLGLLRAHRWCARAKDDERGADPQARCRALAASYLDLANWLFGACPTEVYARGGESGYLQIHLGFAGGGMAFIDLTEDLPPGDGYRSVTVVGSAGAGYADDHHNRALVFSGGAAAARDPGEGNLHLVAELKEFGAAVAGQRAPQVTGIDAGAALLVAEAAASSVATGAVLERKGEHYE